MTKNVSMKAQRTTVKSWASLKAWMLLCLVMLCAAGVKAQTPYAIWCEENGTLYFTNSTKTYAQGDTYNGQTITTIWSGNKVTNPYSFTDFWYSVMGDCQKAVFDESFKTVKPQTLRYWFYNAPKLTTIEGLEYLDTSEATSMKDMFLGCSSLTSLDVSHFDTRNVKNMSGMFLNCSGLTSITGIENLNTSNVTDMGSMFSGCSSLASLDLRNFEINLPLAAQPDPFMFNSMFQDCSSLTTIYCDTDWNEIISIYNEQASGINQMIGASKMFEGCTSLVGGKGTKYDESKIHNQYARPDLPGLPGYFTSDREYEIKPYAIWCADNATFTFVNSAKAYVDGGVYDGTIITKVWSGEQVTETAGWKEDFSHNEDMNLHIECQKIVFDESFKDVKPSNLSQWFYYFEKVTSIEGIEYLNTSEATKMGWMFRSCSELTTIDVSNFDTSKVTDMSSMFHGCSGLTNILGLEKLNTSNVTNMTEMFHTCKGLTNIDVSNFDTRNVTDMSWMFFNCHNLTSISGIENLNTSNVTNMRNMFNGCSALTVLDLSSFDVSKVVNINQMFDGCKSLKRIYSKNDWNTQYSGTTSTAYMFNDCTSLIGGNGTEYSRAYTNGIYANLDVNGKRGYFTSTFEYAISSATVGTLYMDYAVNIPEADYFDAYYVKSINSEGTLYLKKVKDVIPANTGVIIFGNEGTYKMVQISKEVPAINDNLLCSVAEETSVADLQTKHGKDIYVLSRGKDSYINFLKAGSGVKNIPANRAYLPYSSASGAKELTIAFDEEGSEATGIDNVATEKAERTGVYNLAGQRVTKPQHGIYIVNGKKVVIK